MHFPDWLSYVAHNMQCCISQWYISVFDRFQVLLNANSMSPGFNLNQGDAELRFELDLFIQSSAICIALQLIHIVVCISVSQCSCFSPSIQLMDLKFDKLVKIHVYHPVHICSCPSLQLRMGFGERAPGTGWLCTISPQLLLPMMLEWRIKKLLLNRCHLMDLTLQSLWCPLPISFCTIRLLLIKLYSDSPGIASML